MNPMSNITGPWWRPDWRRHQRPSRTRVALGILGVIGIVSLLVILALIQY